MQYGNGGIISHIYQRYHTFSPWIELNYSSNQKEFKPENVYQWVDEHQNGFHSEISQERKVEYLSFHFKKPFLPKGFSILMVKGFRFPNESLFKSL